MRISCRRRRCRCSRAQKLILFFPVGFVFAWLTGVEPNEREKTPWDHGSVYTKSHVCWLYGVMHCVPNVAHLQTQQQLKTRRNKYGRHNDSRKWARNISSFRNPHTRNLTFSFWQNKSKFVCTHACYRTSAARMMRPNKTIHCSEFRCMKEWNLLRAANVNNISVLFAYFFLPISLES